MRNFKFVTLNLSTFSRAGTLESLTLKSLPVGSRYKMCLIVYETSAVGYAVRARANTFARLFARAPFARDFWSFRASKVANRSRFRFCARPWSRTVRATITGRANMVAQLVL